MITLTLIHSTCLDVSELMQQRSVSDCVSFMYNLVRNLYIMKVFSQRNRPPIQAENLSTKELKVLDKVSITSVVDFMRKFQEDATFSPPSVGVTFDSDNYDVNIDDDGEVPSLFDSLEDYDLDEIRDAMKLNKRDAKNEE